jgi:type VI protein secretion system component VasK
MKRTRGDPRSPTTPWQRLLATLAITVVWTLVLAILLVQGRQLEPTRAATFAPDEAMSGRLPDAPPKP